MLGDMIRRERERRGLSMREAARRIGISAAYLVELEHDRNPTTGRAPLPSPVVLAGIERALGIGMATLLDLAGAAPPRSRHTLLVLATGSAPPDAAAASGASEAPWVAIGAAGSPAAALEATATAVASRTTPFGLVFASSSSRLRRDAAAVVAAERTWEADVSATCEAAAGAEPVANVCVYRAGDLRKPAGADPLDVALGLVRAHPRVAVQDPRGRVTTGPAAIEAILGLVRPAAVAPETWASLSAAAAAGLHRETAAG